MKRRYLAGGRFSPRGRTAPPLGETRADRFAGSVLHCARQLKGSGRQMILSHRNKFIFMHSRKTAGSSITALLNRHLGPDDIQIGAWPDAIEAGGKYNRRALLIAMRSPLALGFESLKHSVKKRKPEIAPHFVNTVTRLHYANKHDFRAGAHISARQVAEFDPDSWSRYYKFCFVRNPWTHGVSDYQWGCILRGVAGVPFM